MRQNPVTLEHLIEDLTRGNVTEVKVVLASVVLALAAYQLLLAGAVYGRVRLPFLSPEAAASAGCCRSSASRWRRCSRSSG